jgi:hypothetical protein
MNPFKFGTIVENDFFTDRKEECELLKQKLDSENHIVLISPRRFGKSSLVQKVLSEVGRPYIKLDLQYVLSVQDFSAQLLKALFKLHPYEKIKHQMAHFRVVPTISTNAVTGAMDVSFQTNNNTSVLLEDAMALLEKSTNNNKRLIVVFDEFQEIQSIQKGFDKQLRSIMQQQKGLNYILLGSQESMMEEIFEKKKSPFYHFGQLIRLQKIPYQDFYNYIEERLPQCANNCDVPREILSFTKCHPYYTQQLSSQVWELMTYQNVTENVVEQAVTQLVVMHDLDFERLWLNLNRTDRKTLRQVALGQNPLQNRDVPTSTVFSSLKRNAVNGYLIKTTAYELEDPFFARWIISQE